MHRSPGQCLPIQTQSTGAYLHTRTPSVDIIELGMEQRPGQGQVLVYRGPRRPGILLARMCVKLYAPSPRYARTPPPKVRTHLSWHRVYQPHGVLKTPLWPVGPDAHWPTLTRRLPPHPDNCASRWTRPRTALLRVRVSISSRHARNPTYYHAGRAWQTQRTVPWTRRISVMMHSRGQGLGRSRSGCSNFPISHCPCPCPVLAARLGSLSRPQMHRYVACPNMMGNVLIDTTHQQETARDRTYDPTEAYGVQTEKL